jgi:hypothetical protein
VRVHVGRYADPPAKEGLAAFVVRLIAADSALKALAPEVSTAPLVNDGYFDIAVTVPAANVRPSLDVMSRALRVSGFSTAQVDAERARGLPAASGGGGRERGGGGGTATPTTESRTRVLRDIANTWRATDSATLASLEKITPADVRTFLAEHVGGGGTSVSIVAPEAPVALLDAGSEAFGTLRKTRETSNRRSRRSARSLKA